MTQRQRIVRAFQKYPKLYSCLVLPYYIGRFFVASLRNRSLWFYRYPPGHYGSTIPSQREIDRRKADIFDRSKKELPGIDLNSEHQLGLLRKFSSLRASFVCSRRPTGGARYYYDNELFERSDALVLYCFLMHFRPRQVVEIGSGFSSALMLDARESALPELRLTFIEPYPARLKTLMRDRDRDACTIIEKKAQEVPLDLFRNLRSNSLVFVDSSHVLKIGSDLSTIFFAILPALKSGVLVHIHDIFWPFEYPREMIAEGRNWNENYFARSFLQYNSAFEICFYSSYLEKVYTDDFRKSLGKPKGRPACGLWLRKK